MTRTLALLAAALLASLALASVPSADAALNCAPASPFPPGPGGEVGRVYTFAASTAHGGVLTAMGLTCSTIAFASATAETVCFFLLGTGCPP